MLPSLYFKKFVADIVKRSGISRPTVEAVLPAVFDEIRYRLCEGKTPSIQIESFGTIAVTDKPAHQYHSNYKGVQKVCDVPAHKVIKFSPARNLKREIEAGCFDPTRRSFVHHPADPVLRKRQNMKYQKGRPVNARPIYTKDQDSD
jgi:nucleoid DNA-binding protein